MAVAADGTIEVMDPAAPGSEPDELAQLAAAVDAGGDLLAIFDGDGKVRALNRAAREFFGIEVHGPVPDFGPAQLLASPDAKVAEIGQALLDGVGRWEGEIDLAGARGRRSRFSLIVLAQTDEHGAVESYSAIGRDIGPLRDAELRLGEHQAWWRSLVQHGSDVVMVFDGAFRIKYASPSIERVFGHRPDDVVGKPMPGRESGDPRLGAIYREVASQPGGSAQYETTITTADGSRRTLECTLSNLLDDPAVQGYVVNASDVTDRHRAEEARRRTEALLRSIVQNSPLAIHAIDATGAIQLWNRACETLYGWAADEVIGTRPPHLAGDAGDDDHDDYHDICTRVFAGETITGAEMRRRRHDGTSIDVSFSMAPLRQRDGRVVSAVAVAVDITESRRAREELERSERALAESEARYRGIVEDQTELVCRYRPDTTLTYVNRAFAQYYGGTPESFIGRRLIELFPPEQQADELARLATFGPGHEVELQEDWEPRHDGMLRWFQWTDRAYLDAGGRVVEFQSVGNDVHDRRQAARSLRWQAEILEMVATGAELDDTLLAIARIAESEQSWRCLVMLCDGDELFPVAAPTLPLGFLDALGRLPIAEGAAACGTAAFRREPVLSRDLATDPAWRDRHARLSRFDVRAAWSVPFVVRGTVTGTICLYGSGAGEPDGEQRRIVGLLARLAAIALERKRFEDELVHQSLHDELTDLPNRTLFLDRLGLALGRASRLRAGLAVLLVDIDDFKSVNDSLGHRIGDSVLQAFAARVEAVLRPGDTLARFSGDEFVLLCEDLPGDSARDAATHIATRVLEALARPFVIDGVELFLRASIGIALAGDRPERAEHLLRDADAAAYHAKELGRGRWVVFDEPLRERVVAEHTTFNELHRALDRGELRVFFQPVVDLRDGHCSGAEALVRWQHPERGLVGPDEFIALAEQSDLIVQVGDFVLREAARDAAEWGASRRTPFVVSVNLSGRQLAQPDLAERVAAILAEERCRPEQLGLEITESVLMREPDRAVAAVDALRALGVRVSIDDFGTGYSSLAYLKRFSVDAVKVDRSFVDGLGRDPGDHAIVAAVIRMAHALGLRVVAEGVEHEGQLDELVALGCDEAQGFFFAPPQPVRDLSELMPRTRRWRRHLTA